MKVLKFPNPKLKKPSEPMTEEDIKAPWFIEAVEEMTKLLYESVAYGIAAPQVDISRRFILVDANWMETGEKKVDVILNPYVTRGEGDILSKGEMCLSVPMLSVDVIRQDEITVTGVDTDWNPVTFQAEGLESCVIQHEIDHLDGILLVDKIGNQQRNIYKTRLKKKKFKDIMRVWRPDR